LTLYRHVAHAHVAARQDAGPVKSADQYQRGNWYKRFNAKIAIWVTVGVGSMSCAWAFAILALAGLPTALKPGNIGLLFWISSDLLQLTLLSVIIVGQNIQALAADKRAQQTFLDVEALLHGQDQLAAHQGMQDALLAKIAEHLGIDPGAATATQAGP
jgi:hypothetical protein